jgi:protein SCO1
LLRGFVSGAAAVVAVLVAALASASVSYLPPIEKAPPFALVDQNARAVTSSDLNGSVVLLTFMYTHCTTVCPLVTERMAAVAKLLAHAGVLGKGVKLVSISFDPARDTPGWLATYSRSAGADARSWLFLTGPPSELARLLERYDFYVGKLPSGDFDHVSRVYLIDAGGTIRQIYSVSFLDPARVERDVASLIAERRQANRMRSR